MKGKLNLWQYLLLASVIVVSFCLTPRSDIPVIASTAAGPLIPVDTGERDRIRLATPVIGRESIASNKGNLRYPMQSIPEESAANGAKSVGTFPGSISNSRELEIPALADTGAWQCYQDGGPACYTHIRSVAMVSADEGWAVGHGGMVLHYLDGEWRVTIGPDPLHSLESIAMLDANDGWAVGIDYNQSKTLFLHWDGNTWSELDTQNIGYPYSVDMISASDGWAVGDASRNSYSGYIIAHWDGQTWLEFPSPTGCGLSSVWMLSPDEGWAVGMGAILHYEGQAHRLHLPLIFNNHLYCAQDSLVNGNFEQDDAGWELFTSGTGPKAHDLVGSVDEGFNPYAGDYAARLGGYEGVWDTIEQTVIIPAQGRLSYWWMMGTYEILPHHDSLTVDLLQPDGTFVTQLARHDDQDLEGVWQQDSIDVSAYAGQELVLRFASYNDNYYYSWFDIDEVRLYGP